MKITMKGAALAIALSAAAPAFANCEAVVESNDAMQYNVKEIVVDKSCENFTITLKHVGKLPKASMGHNLVITETANVRDVSAAAVTAGAAKDYIPEGDARIIAHTKLIGGGESDSVTFPVSKLTAGGDYTFFCSFPGHSAVMKGALKI
jgi:azurin